MNHKYITLNAQKVLKIDTKNTDVPWCDSLSDTAYLQNQIESWHNCTFIPNFTTVLELNVQFSFY